MLCCFFSLSYCSEIEFTLRFGCDKPTHIDQGVRFEISTSAERNWAPIRFYAPSLVPSVHEDGTTPTVHLEPEGNSVEATTASYTTSLPLLNLNSTAMSEGVIIREYLCQQYVASFRSGQRIQLRWLQRYLTNPQADVATWSLDNIRIRLWDGKCFLPLLSEDFSSATPSLPESVRYIFLKGSIQSPPCLSNQNNSVLYFNEGFSNGQIRRSLMIILNGHDLTSCENHEDMCTDSSK